MKKFIRPLIIAAGMLVALCIVGIFLLMPSRQMATNYTPFFPLGLQMQCAQVVDKEDNNLIISYSVDQADQNYVYKYKLEYKGTHHYLLQWEVLERALNSKVILDLSPNSVHEFKIQSSQPPMFIMGQTRIMEQTKLNEKDINASVWSPITEPKASDYIGPIPVK
jgi:hypothetical protein